jgi:putative transposase
VGRLLQSAGLRAKRARRFVGTTRSVAGEPWPNWLGRQFGVGHVAGRDRIWVADATACWTGEGWLYLAVVLDLGSRLERYTLLARPPKDERDWSGLGEG